MCTVFIADPVGFANQHGVAIDREFALFMRDVMRKVEQQAASAIVKPRQTSATVSMTSSPTPTVFSLAMAVSAVVRAVTAVVSAVSVTYMATKWNTEA